MSGGPFPSLTSILLVDQKSAQFVKFGAEPQFSPDGKWIAYVGHADATRLLFSRFLVPERMSRYPMSPDLHSHAGAATAGRFSLFSRIEN